MKTKSTFLKKIGAAALAAGVVIGSLAVSGQPVSAASKFKVEKAANEQTYTYEDGTAYLEASYEYPQITDDSAAAAKINNYLKKQYEKWKAQLDKDAVDYKTDYESYLGSLNNEEKPRWTYTDTVTYEVTNNDGKYFSVLLSGYLYTGGAHGMPYRIPMTFDAATGEKLTAAKILGTTKAKTNAKVRKLYLKQYDKKGAEAGFYGEGASGREALQKTLNGMNFNNTFYVKNGKLVFYADPYILGPYAAGFMEVTKSV